MKSYVYGMRLRGFSPGCQPMRGLLRRKDDPLGMYWDVIVYSRKLTEEELAGYDLDYLKEEEINESNTF